jgi:hypothetical protein
MDRFWSKVKKSDGCWEWIGAKDGCGYGKLGLGGKLIGAHRMAWILSFGPIPEGLSVCHRCDNPGCVNPGHLFVASHRGNMLDMVAKHRHNQAWNHF